MTTNTGTVAGVLTGRTATAACPAPTRYRSTRPVLLGGSYTPISRRHAQDTQTPSGAHFGATIRQKGSSIATCLANMKGKRPMMGRMWPIYPIGLVIALANTLAFALEGEVTSAFWSGSVALWVSVAWTNETESREEQG